MEFLFSTLTPFFLNILPFSLQTILDCIVGVPHVSHTTPEPQKGVHACDVIGENKKHFIKRVQYTYIVGVRKI